MGTNYALGYKRSILNRFRRGLLLLSCFNIFFSGRPLNYLIKTLLFFDSHFRDLQSVQNLPRGCYFLQNCLKHQNLLHQEHSSKNLFKRLLFSMAGWSVDNLPCSPGCSIDYFFERGYCWIHLLWQLLRIWSTSNLVYYISIVPYLN